MRTAHFIAMLLSGFGIGWWLAEFDLDSLMLLHDLFIGYYRPILSPVLFFATGMMIGHFLRRPKHGRR